MEFIDVTIMCTKYEFKTFFVGLIITLGLVFSHFQMAFVANLISNLTKNLFLNSCLILALKSWE
jgi:hypothetical protein